KLSTICGNAKARRRYPGLLSRQPDPLQRPDPPAPLAWPNRACWFRSPEVLPVPVLHQMQMSGNCYKVRLTARQVGVLLTLRDYSEFGGETRTPEFLAKNPNGRVPLLEWEDGRMLPESGAIIWHLAEGSALAPDDAWSR